MIENTDFDACALDPLVTDRQEAHEIRHDAQATDRIMADAMPQIVWTALPDGTRDYFNQRWFEHTGIAPEETGEWDWIDALHEQDRDRCRGAWQAAVGDSEPFQIEYRLYCAEDGTYRWHIERALPVLTPNGTVVKWFGACTDVEELKQARAEIEALNVRLQRAMTETHHRVKNNLQIIMAMVDMQLDAGADTISAQDVKRLGTHIRTIAAVHDILTQAAREKEQTERVSVKDILEQLLPIHQQTAPNCVIRAEITDVQLPGRKGTALALTINELISNAIKHGKSLVEVIVAARDSKIDVTVCDDGPGFPEGFDPKKAANTGLDLVENLVRWDLNGRVTFGNQPQGGAQVSLVIPT